METIIYKDSPLASYLEGHGRAEHEWESTAPAPEPFPSEPISFAPRGTPAAYSKFRRKLPTALKLDSPLSKGAVTRFHDTCTSALKSRLGRSDNAHFLEQFRYTIVASQLLNDHAKPTAYNPLQSQQEPTLIEDGESKYAFSWWAICSTVLAAFAVAWSMQWARAFLSTRSSWLVACMIFAFALIALVALYAFFRRQWLQYLRSQAVDNASSLVSNTQSLIAATSAAVMLIQEVELVSRGYRISSPLPPISRLEEQSQTPRCARLRRSLNLALLNTIVSYAEAYETLRPHATEVDFEKYCDIYEISQTDIQEAAELGFREQDETENWETLRALKISIHKLHLVKKLLLCTLLALDADGSEMDFARWSLAIDVMQTLASKSADAVVDLDKILGEEDRYALPPTPKIPLTPGRERMRTQMRKVSSLSQGIRGLQAKLHILREESDRTLDESNEVDLGSNIMSQYESIGADLKSLMQEWEDGKAALVVNIGKHERRISTSSNGLLLSVSRSSTPSLGGLTAVGGGSPTDALRILNGEARSQTSAESTSSDEEVFEAVALPRQRSTLTREERIAKMKEDRVRRDIAKENTDASTHMLKELETVIKLRPRGRTTGRLTSI